MTPYLRPYMLRDLPTGVQWNTLPRPGATGAEQEALQTDLCWAATHWADAYANQVLRATLDYEVHAAPGWRAAWNRDGVLEILCHRWPVLSVAAAWFRPVSSSENDWQPIPADGISLGTTPGSEEITAGGGTSLVRLRGVPRTGTWGGMLVRLQYVNGWPHASLTSAVSAGATTLPLDDVTGISAGLKLQVHDGGYTEWVTVASVSGSSVVLTAGLAYNHAAGVVVSALPQTVMTACGYYAAYLALQRGATAIAVPPVPGAGGGQPGQPGRGMLELAMQHLAPYRRIY